MKKQILALLLVIITLSGLFAELPDMNIIRKRQVAPGAEHTVLNCPSKPWIIHILEMDLNNGNLDLKAVDGNGLKKPSLMAADEENASYRLVGAINGDFFEPDYRSTNANIMEGEILKLEKLSATSPTYWSAVTFNDKDRPVISCNQFHASVCAAGSSMEINDVNEAVNDNELVFYNSHYGTSTGNSAGVEISLSACSPWNVNDTVKCVMESKSTSGNTSLTTSTAVLSGHGTAADFLNSIYVSGDTLSLYLGMRAFHDLSVSGVSYNYLELVSPIKYLVGGYPMIVKDGENYGYEGYRNENGSGSFAADLHPRTALGVSEDSSRIIFAVVDGRQDESIGMSLIELADLMIEFGAFRAMNFDGGGSSAMIVNGQIQNSPSDGHERSVRNCLAVYSTASQGDISRLQIELDTLNLYKGTAGQFFVSSWDDNYNPKSIADWNNITFSQSSDLGTASGSSGDYLFTANESGMDGYIYANYSQGIKDSLYLHINILDPIMLNPPTAFTDTNSTIQFTVSGINEIGDTLIVDPAVFHFLVENEQVGTISSEGVFTGLESGSSKVYAYYGDQVDSAVVQVFIGEGEIPLDPIENIDNWVLTGENLNMDSSYVSLCDRPDAANGNKALKLDYKTTDNGKIYLSKDISVPGIPETILLDFRGDGLKHRVYIELEDASADMYTIYQSGYVDYDDEYKTLFMDMSTIDPVFPVSIKNIYIKLKKGLVQGSLYMDNLRLVYPGHTSIEESLQNLPQSYKITGVYPNPFNPDLQISYDLYKTAEVDLCIYDLQGHCVANIYTGMQDAGSFTYHWVPQQEGSGCYIYRLTVNDKVETGKCVYLK